jgi:hypothetical protein
MNPISSICWVVFIDCLISIAIMIRGEIIESDFHKYVAIGLTCISAILLFTACLFA